MREINGAEKEGSRVVIILIMKKWHYLDQVVP